MSRQPTSTQYFQPIKSDGTAAAAAGGETNLGTSNRGVFTLASGTTYFVPLGGQDASKLHVMLQGDAEILITSATIEETDLAPSEASDYANGAGEWFATNIDRITSTAEGTNWINTNDVGGNGAGGNRGGVVWNIADHGARRTRLAIVVGATGGQVRVSGWAKE